MPTKHLQWQAHELEEGGERRSRGEWEVAAGICVRAALSLAHRHGPAFLFFWLGSGPKRRRFGPAFFLGLGYRAKKKKKKVKEAIGLLGSRYSLEAQWLLWVLIFFFLVEFILSKHFT